MEGPKKSHKKKGCNTPRPNKEFKKSFPNHSTVQKVVLVKDYSAIASLFLLIKRPGVAGAVLQTPLSFMTFIHSLNKRFSDPLVKISSKHRLSQTIRARELKFEKMFTPHNGSHVTCHMSCVTCHMARVTFHVCHVMF